MKATAPLLSEQLEMMNEWIWHLDYLCLPTGLGTITCYLAWSTK